MQSIMALLEELAAVTAALPAARLHALVLLCALCHAGTDVAAQLINAGACLQMVCFAQASVCTRLDLDSWVHAGLGALLPRYLLASSAAEAADSLGLQVHLLDMCPAMTTFVASATNFIEPEPRL